MLDVLIIGAGATGSLLARELSQYKLNVLVIDKENDVGNVTSMANSAIVHSGYDPVPGSKKAIFNVKGNAMFPSLCEDLDVEFNKCGTLTVATENKQLEVLSSLLERAKQNKVEAKLLSAIEVKEIEPNISSEVKGALLCPSGGIVNPFTLVVHAMENAMDNGVKLELNQEVIGIKYLDDHFEVKTNKDIFEAKIVVNCAGLFSDKIAAMIEDISWSISPRKGEYYVLDHYEKGLVNHVLFPLPSEKGKGILVTMTTSGNYLVGPSSEFVKGKDDFSTDSLTLSKVKAEASIMVPKIPFNQQIRVFSGLRSTPSTHDFIIEPAKTNKYFINVAGIESPGLVSSPAIAEYVSKELISKLILLDKKENWSGKVKKYVKPLLLEEKERAKFLKENPKYGHIICDCEKISIGEIEDVLSRSVPCNSIKAVKKRTRAGFGKCQGGFCQPQVLFLLAKHFNLDPLSIVYDKEESYILEEKSK